MLLEYGYPTNELSIWQTLIRAIYTDNIEIVRYLCEERSAPVSYAYQDNASPMEAAAMRGSVAIAEYLVSRGVDITREEDCLPNAVMKGHAEMVKYLLAQGRPLRRLRTRCTKRYRMDVWTCWNCSLKLGLM